MSVQRAAFVTDTATLSVFDLAALKDRLRDAADWWTLPSEELAEVKAGNVAFVSLGEDGRYSIEVCPAAREARTVIYRLRVPSGRVFVGAGEEVTSDGLEPEGVRGGCFLDVCPGVRELRVVRIGPRELRLQLSPCAGLPTNGFREPLRL